MQAETIIGAQIRAARGALNWSVKDLAERTGVGTATIVRYEMAEGVPPTRKGNLDLIRRALEAAGIEFTGSAQGAPGIVMHFHLRTKVQKSATVAEG